MAALFHAIHHVAIIASDYEKSRHFYVDLLGFEIVRENYRESRGDYKLDLKLGDCELEIFGIPGSPARPNYPEASSKCTLTGKERRTAICKMLHNPRVDQALRLAKPRSGYMKLMLIPIRIKNTYLTWLESALITFVKERNTKLFAKLKAGR